MTNTSDNAFQITDSIIIGNYISACAKFHKTFFGYNEVLTFKINFINMLKQCDDFITSDINLSSVENAKFEEALKFFINKYPYIAKECPWSFQEYGNPCYEIKPIAKDNPDMLINKFSNHLPLFVSECFNSVTNYMFNL